MGTSDITQPTTDGHDFDWGRRELALTSCPVTYSEAPWHTHIQ